MPTPTKGPRLGGSPAHERLMLANLATSLFRHGRITTTEVKAKRLRPLAEQLITKATKASARKAAKTEAVPALAGDDEVVVKPARAGKAAQPAEEPEAADTDSGAAAAEAPEEPAEGAPS